MRTIFVYLLLAVFSSLSLAHNKVVVIPMAGDDAVPIKNIVTVGLENADFKDPAAALASITDASSLEPYLVFIGPGTYTIGEPLVIESNIHLVGSGIGTTILEAGYGSSQTEDSAVVSMQGIRFQEPAYLSDLSIYQYGSSVGISSGIYAERYIEISNVEVRVTSSGTVNYGIFLDGALANIDGAEINLDNAQSSSTGIYVRGATTEVRNASVSVRSGIFVAGIYNEDAFLTVRNVDSHSQWQSGTTSIWGIYGRSNLVGPYSGTFYSKFTIGGTSPQSVPNSGGCFMNTVSRNNFNYTQLSYGCNGGTTATTLCLYSNNGSAKFQVDCVGLE